MESKTYSCLKEGIKKYAIEVQEQSADLLANLAKGQSPKIFFLTCSDSRIAPSRLTGAGLGDLFVVRNAGNIISPVEGSAELAALEFAVKALKITDVVISGHTRCGAMAAAVAKEAPVELKHVCSWISHVADVAKEANGDLDKCIELNVLKQMAYVRTLDFIDESIKVHGWVYDISNGKVREYNPKTKVFELIN